MDGKVDKARKKDFIENKPKEDSAHANASATDVDKCTWVREVISSLRSSISKSIRLQRKNKFQENKEALPHIAEMERFLTVMTL